ncbi:MAG: hypothetical protein LAT75_10940 [Candidatus Cyclonatronum sp.]|uniref:hypothetical protein n=1 Tax=Cyclonatronum sp. TaxID=3024185 RepID=UPI0025C4DB9B|nr:hypothetical protein [Cyclonatronum sp.]MCC5934567.1 hypothetical protein [Balneolales bacterium]MCH8487370.1 hypothetical protein [Cyclonatronum sp.]
MKKHPNKEIQKAIEYAQTQSWVLKDSGKSSHSWGRLMCPESSRNGCVISVWSTPRNPENHAKQILKMVNKCPHKEQD